ncbi:energy-coupling factor transporter transmembrane protein EcfT [Streptococcus sp. NLN76]|uniref:energy-coupling factor transporter transmembrane component T family protein n=1 Tax=Streptococcus sp. NLN76 TaxID=2822800 RepID=UPI0018ABB0DC|nr:energy-coupling factor transporter transmembrane protein EcfT [Streptococcus sp. NLN76]MBF8970900.1 energy-coupling factor transporter transmembrane protein EcfT [Streptococcus sp. NLN76]
MDKLILGRYIPGSSFIHRLDPRAKLLGMFAFVLMIFWANNFVTNVLVLLVTACLLLLSGLPLKVYWDGLKPMWFLIIFTISFQLFTLNSGAPLLQWGWLTITDKGLIQAAIIFIRFLTIVLWSTVLTLTTMPLTLARAIESLLKPLKVVRFPVQEVGLMLSMSLRFIPTLMDDTVKVMNAQRARGVDFGEGNLLEKAKSFIPILIPLFASSFKRADALATAMEARGYQVGADRTSYRKLTWKSADSLSIFLLFCLALALFFLKN